MFPLKLEEPGALKRKVTLNSELACGKDTEAFTGSQLVEIQSFLHGPFWGNGPEFTILTGLRAAWNLLTPPGLCSFWDSTLSLTCPHLKEGEKEVTFK